jgi:hypothetical protein
LQELSKFVKAPLPEGRLDYRPDPKARTARELAWLLAAGVVEWAGSCPRSTGPPRTIRASSLPWIPPEVEMRMPVQK